MIDLFQLLPKLGFKNLKQANNEWVSFSCPLAPYSVEHKFSEDVNPSAGAIVGEDNQVHWNCFCCKNGGNITNLLKYLSKKEKSNLDDIILELESGVFYKSFDDFVIQKKNYEEDKPIPSFIYNKLFEPLPIEASKYLHSRKISGKTSRLTSLRFDTRNQRIVFPYIRNGQVYGVAGRTIIDETPKVKNQVFNIRNFLLGEHLWQNKPTVLVEGLFGYLKLHELGFSENYDIAALSGTVLSEAHLNILSKKDLPVILFLDGDAAGLSGMNKAQEMLKSEVTVYRVKYKEKTDIDDLTLQEITDMLLEATEQVVY